LGCNSREKVRHWGVGVFEGWKERGRGEVCYCVRDPRWSEETYCDEGSVLGAI